MQLSILSFTKFKSLIFVDCRINGVIKTTIIQRSKFESFLKKYGILSPMQLHDMEGGFELAFTAMTMKEYYSYGNVANDLHDFFLFNRSQLPIR